MSSNDHLYRFSAALGATAAGMALSTSLALATGGGGYGSEGSGYGDSAQIEITGSIPEVCEFTSVPPNTTLDSLANGDDQDLGDLAFTCNFATSTNVQLKATSANGALERVGGSESESVAYSVSWSLYNAGAYVPATDWLGGDEFYLPSGLNASVQTGLLKVLITGSPVGLPAGEYKDILTFEISP